MTRLFGKGRIKSNKKIAHWRGEVYKNMVAQTEKQVSDLQDRYLDVCHSIFKDVFSSDKNAFDSWVDETDLIPEMFSFIKDGERIIEGLRLFLENNSSTCECEAGRDDTPCSFCFDTLDKKEMIF